MKKLISTLSIATLLAGSAALAQTTTTPQTPSTTPPAVTPAPSPSMTPDTSRPSMTTPGAKAPSTSVSGDLQWKSRYNNEARASKMIGAKVQNAAGESIGDINELLVDDAGRVQAVVIGVGGFLGLGEREVAVSYESVRVGRDANGSAIMTVNATKESLKDAPAWQWPQT